MIPTPDAPRRALSALYLENVHPEAAPALEHAGFTVSSRREALGEADLAAALDGVHVLGIRSTTQVSEKVLDAAPDLLAIGAFCIGTNQIDLAAASDARRSPVFNAPFSNTRSVVELALAEIIALTRAADREERAMHAGVWDKSATGSARGARPQARHRRLRQHRHPAVGARREPRHARVLLRHRPTSSPWATPAAAPRLDELLDVGRRGHPARGRTAPATAGCSARKQFARDARRALFLNLSRGFVVDHDALRRHLESGHLAGAAVDVFPDEPKGRDEEFVSTLRGLPT